MLAWLICSLGVLLVTRPRRVNDSELFLSCRCSSMSVVGVMEPHKRQKAMLRTTPPTHHHHHTHTHMRRIYRPQVMRSGPVRMFQQLAELWGGAQQVSVFSSCRAAG